MDKFRNEFLITKKYAYFNHAAISPPSLMVDQAFEDVCSQYREHGVLCHEKWIERVREVRGLCAGLINAESDEIALIGNTSEGLSLIAQGLRLKPGDKVLLTEPEFPSNIYPWLNLREKGVDVLFIKRDNGRFNVRDVENALSPDVKIISVSSVDFITGFHCDLKAIGDLCKRKGILFCVDGIQGLGAIPVDVKECGIHFFSSGGYKWLLGMMGTGMLFISKEAQRFIRPVSVGWKSVKNDEDFLNISLDFKPDASCFEPGGLNIPGLHAFGVSIGLINEAGIENIKGKIFELNNLFFKGLCKRGYEVVTSMEDSERSGILSFKPSGSAKGLCDFLRRRNVIVSDRAGLIRISPHFYNNEEDVKAFFDAIDVY